jgi:TonB-dependent starch-binding outer membrane protein SusC
MKTLRTLLAVALSLALAPAAAFAQGGTIRGVVTEQGSGQPLQGVAVSVVGTNQTVVTNQEGRYAINNVAAGQRTVRATRIGYAAGSATVNVGAAGAEANFQLSPDVLGLDELVVIGYGQTERRNVTGAVASISPEQTQDLPTPTVAEVLQGRVAGVQVQQNSGTPGSAISVRVRGASSISAGNQPLYVVDGVPLIQGDFSAFGSGTLGGQGIDALADLNPNEIESIQVLKDASAAAIYGARASNGVVLITTRRGRAGERPEIRLNTYYGVQEAWRTPGFLNTDQYLNVYDQTWANDGLPGFGLGANLWEYQGYGEPDASINTNWLDEVMGTAPITETNASISGGNERTRYFVSGTVFNQEGVVQPQAYERLNGRVNLDFSASDKVTLGTSLALTRSVMDRAAADNSVISPFANAIAAPPIQPVYQENGEYDPGFFYINPVAIRQHQVEERNFHVIGNAFANWQITDALSGRVTAGLDQFSLRSYLYYSPLLYPGSGSGGSSTVGNTTASKVLFEGTLNFNRDFGDNNAFSALAGASYEDNDTESSSVSGSGFPTSAFRFLNSASVIASGGNGLTEYALGSFFGRLSNTYLERLTTTFNIRADASSRFGENNRWGVFPSAAVLYRFGDELLDGQGVVSDLAVRASYGLTGNQEGLGNFASLGLFGGGAAYDDEAGIAPSQLANPDLSWEKTSQLNLGGDVGFFDDRLGLSFDWYYKNTTDLLLDRPVPFSTGFATITENIGSMRNAGVELAARAQVIRGREEGSLNWSTELNVATNRNRVTKLYNNLPIGSFVRIEEGKPLGYFYALEENGLFRNADEICYDATGAQCLAEGLHAYQSDETTLGDVRFVDVNGDGVINDLDRTDVGTPWANFTGGWTNTLTWKGVDLTAFFHFSQGNETYNGLREYTDNPGTSGDNLSDRVLDAYSPENPDGTHPRLSFLDPNGNFRQSGLFVEDGSYVRLKNVVLGYRLPASLSGRLGVSRARVYVQGQNLLTWTDYSGFDPEVNYAGDTGVTRGYDFYTLPQARTISVGFDLGL